MASSKADKSALIDSLHSDHRRVETLLARVEALAAAEGTRAAAPAVEELDVVLSRHMYAENEVLVPELELVAESTESEAVILMLQEHEHIRSLLLGLRHCVARDARAPELGAALNQLRHVLHEHAHFEERQVYPLLGSLDRVHERAAATVRSGGEDEEIFGDLLP